MEVTTVIQQQRKRRMTREELWTLPLLAIVVLSLPVDWEWIRISGIEGRQ